MTLAGWFMLLYGAFVLVGAVMGARAGSRASLIAGGVSGLLAVLAGVGMLAGAGWGKWLGVMVSLTLLGFFVPRYLASRSVFPAGVTALLSLIGLIFALIA
jgi:uncharacterized membrane protein (UPF0136 family)